MRDVYITIYGVQTQYLREDIIAIQNRLTLSLTPMLKGIEFTTDYKWSTSSDPRYSIAVLRGKRMDSHKFFYSLKLDGESDAFIDVNISFNEVDLSGNVGLYSLPGLVTGERRMYLNKIVKALGNISAGKVAVHAFSIRVGRSYRYAMVIYGAPEGFIPSIGSYVIKKHERLADLSVDTSALIHTHKYSAGKSSSSRTKATEYDLFSDFGCSFVGKYYDDFSRDTIFVMMNKIDDFARRGLSVVQYNRKLINKSGPSKKGSGAL